MTLTVSVGRCSDDGGGWVVVVVEEVQPTRQRRIKWLLSQPMMSGVSDGDNVKWTITSIGLWPIMKLAH